MTGPSQGLTIGQLVGRWARETPGNLAIVAPGRSPLTYSLLFAEIEAAVSTLNEMGLGRNDRIAIVLPNGPEMAVAFLVAGSAATCAPLNPAYRASEFDFYLSDLEAKALMLQSGVESPARTVALERGIPIIELAPRVAAEAGLFTLTGNLSSPAKQSGFAEPDDVALVLHTSGTTARPKIVPLTHQNLCASARHIRETLALAPHDCCLNVMPLFHIHGLIGAALSSLASGASVVCTPGFYAPKFFEWMDEFRPSWYTAVPTMHQAILSRASTHREIIVRSPLRLIRSSSAALPPQVMAELESVFKAPVIESYGMTEASHQMASNPLPPRVRKPGSVGVAAGPEIVILGDTGSLLPAQSNGEIAIRGRNVIAGYENNAVANAGAFTNGWFRTGDQGYFDTDGYLFINGRLKEIINRGGEKISPREIDEILLSHPAVAQAATFAIPHTKLGEEIGAAVVLREKSAATERDLREFAAARLADFKVPYRILIVDEIPKGPTGKLQRIGLADKLGLQTINPEMPEPRHEFTGPRNECETALANIWSEVLGQLQVSIHDKFLDLGGDSILGAQVLSRVRRVLRVELPLLVLFEEGANIAGLAKVIQRVRGRGEPLPATEILSGEDGSELPLSFGQERLWFLSQLEPQNPAYNRPAALRLAGPLEIPTLERSLSEIIRRHEVLRSTVSAVDGQPVQIISPASPVRLSAVDLRQVSAGQREAELGLLIAAETQAPFDLRKGLLRLALYRVADEDHVLLLTAHHIVFDGWSMEVFTRELIAFYEAFFAGKPAPLAQLPVQYADFARWQRQWMQPERLKQHVAYWRQHLHEAPTELPFPTDRPRLPVPSYRGGREKVSLSKGLMESLQNLSHEEGATMFMTLLAAWQTLLFRYTQQSDISIGTAIAGRNQKETEGLIGFFVNLLVLRIDLSGDPTFRFLLKRVRAIAFGAYANQDLPFEKLVEALQWKREFNRPPLFQAMFVLKRATPPTIRFCGLTLTPQETGNSMAVFDLALELWEGPDGLHGYLEYSADLFDATTIKRLVGHYHNLLDGIVAAPDARLSHLPLLSKVERHQLVVECNDTRADYANISCLHELIEAQAQRSPDAIAVIFERQELTYQTLDRRANQLAHHLQDLGVAPEMLVGICIERAPDLLVGMLGILKAGGAYVPLDPAYPSDRLAFMLSDSKVSILITTRRCLTKLSGFGGRIVCLDGEQNVFHQKSWDNPTSAVSPENVAYVIYTSGSTGAPKGVLITHRALLNHCLAISQHCVLNVEDRVLQFASMSFDVAAEEIFPSLVSGAAVVIHRHDELTAVAGFSRYLEESGVTVANLPAAYWHEWVSELSRPGPKLPTGLRLVIVGSDCVAPDKLALWRKMGTERIRWCNAYGPTETTITATLYEPKRFDQARAFHSVPIGSPIANVRVYVLDSSLVPTPIGVAGDLFIAGEGLARGYLNQPALTAEKFIPDPFSHRPGARLYRTGDKARYLPDVGLEFLGRADRQVKIRGFRIEPGEIESLLAGHPAVREATVLVREDTPGEKRLVAYVVSSPAPKLHIAELLSLLKQTLPSYMVPSVFFALEKLPRDLSGKINRRALPRPGQARPDLDECYTAARTPIEEKLAGIWEQILRIDQVGVHDDFLELGGHSLLAIQIISRVRDAFQIELPVRTLFDAPTVAELAVRISQFPIEKSRTAKENND